MDAVNVDPLIFALIISLIPFGSLYIISCIVNLVYGVPFARYMKKHYHERWCWLTIMGYGAGGVNPIKAWRYIRNDMDIEDENIVRFKRNARIVTKFFLFSALALFLDCLVFTLLIISRSR